MSAGWVAGSVRARLLLEQRLGRDAIAGLATGGSLREALAQLEGSTYAAAAACPGLEDAQRAVAASTLLALRRLAGWLPRGAAGPLGALAGWFELANAEDRLRYLLGDRRREPFDLGALASAWPRAAGAQSASELRAALAASAWGDPGGDDERAFRLGLRAGWSRRVAAHVPEAAAWTLAALVLLAARELLVTGRPLPQAQAARLPRLGVDWSRATGLAELRRALPPGTAWVLADVEGVDDLWQAETAWWRRLETDAGTLVAGPREGRGVVVGAAVLLGLDAVRVRTALAVAASGGSPAAREVLDALC